MVYRQTDTSCETTCKALWFVTGVAEDACESWGTGAYSDRPSALHPRSCVSLFSVLIQFFLQGDFQAFWKLGLCSTPLSSHHVFHFGSSSQRMNLWVSALYMCPLWCCYLCWIRVYRDPSIFFPFDSSMSLHFFLQNGKFWVSCGLVSVWGKRGREKQATPMFMSVCLRAASQVASPMWLQPREEPPLWWPRQTKQTEQSHFLKRWTYLENQV